MWGGSDDHRASWKPNATNVSVRQRMKGGFMDGVVRLVATDGCDRCSGRSSSTGQSGFNDFTSSNELFIQCDVVPAVWLSQGRRGGWIVAPMFPGGKEMGDGC